MNDSNANKHRQQAESREIEKIEDGFPNSLFV
jgi:hypothetical protein